MTQILPLSHESLVRGLNERMIASFLPCLTYRSFLSFITYSVVVRLGDVCNFLAEGLGEGDVVLHTLPVLSHISLLLTVSVSSFALEMSVSPLPRALAKTT
jgi:hypothetical protein